MFLAVLLGAALKYMWAVGKGSGGIAEHKFLWRNDQIALCGGDTWIGNDLKFVDLDGDFLCGLSSKFF